MVLMLAESEEKFDFRNVKLKHIGNHLEDVRLSNIRFTSEPVTFSLRNCDPSHKTNKRVPHTNSFFHRGTRNSVDFTRLWFRTFDKYDMGTQRLQVIKYLCLQCVKNTHRNDKRAENENEMFTVALAKLETDGRVFLKV